MGCPVVYPAALEETTEPNLSVRRIVHPGARAGVRVELGAPDLHHLRRVLRMKPGEALEAVDGAGRLFSARLLGWESPQIEIGVELAPSMGVSGRIVSCVARLHGSRMDWLIEKLSELGVETLVPLLVERSVPGVPRTDRWRRIAVSAAEQCRRSRLLEIAEPVTVANLAGQLPVGLERILLDAAGPPLRLEADAVGVVLASGPAGGFSETERRTLTDCGFRLASLSGTVLRAETAAMAGAAVAAVSLSYPSASRPGR